jgi:hypothetical protein
MYCRVDVKRILDRHLHLVAAAQTDDRAKHGRRVAVGPRRLAFDERVPSRCDLQLNRVSLFGSVDERRDGQAPVEAHGLTLRKATADETSDEAARHDCGGPDSKLASVQHRLQNEAPFN